MFKFRKAKATLEDILFDFVETRNKLLQYYSDNRELFHETREQRAALEMKEAEIGKELKRTQEVIDNINKFLGENK